MHPWHRHRSAPLGVLFAGAVALLAAGTVAVVFYLSVVRSARGLPAYTAGIPHAQVAHPRWYRASYRVWLRGPFGRQTPAGTPSAAHRWQITAKESPGKVLCQGTADNGLIAVDVSGIRPVDLPVPHGMYVRSPARHVPMRLLAVCPDAAAALAHGTLEYTEDVLALDTPVEIIACTHRTNEPGVLAPCNDGAPSRIYPREIHARARLQTPAAMVRVGGCAGVFAAAYFIAGLVALRRFDREQKIVR